MRRHGGGASRDERAQRLRASPPRRRPGLQRRLGRSLRQGFRHHVRSVALDKAINGTVERRYYHGRLVAEERVYSERLLLKLIDRGEKLFGGAPESDAILADWDGAMERLESGALEGGYRVWRDRYGCWMTNFPPPPGFDNYLGEPTDPDFERTLTEAEEEALAARQEARVEAGVARATCSSASLRATARKIDAND